MKPIFRLGLWAVVAVTMLAASPNAAPQSSSSSRPSPTAASAAKQSNSELESAVSQFSRREEDLPKGPMPRTADGRPDLSGYWVPSSKDKPVGNLGKDFPGFKLPFTPAGRAALKYNVEHTIDPESLCIVGGIPRHDASALPFQLLQGADHIAFLYWYTTYRLVPTDGRKHSDDPDPTFFGEEVGNWEGDTLVIDSIAFKDKRTWADENANPHSDRLHTVERWTRPDAGHLHLESHRDRSEVLHRADSLRAHMAHRRARPASAGILVRGRKRRCAASPAGPRTDWTRWPARFRQTRAASPSAGQGSSGKDLDPELTVQRRFTRFAVLLRALAPPII